LPYLLDDAVVVVAAFGAAADGAVGAFIVAVAVVAVVVIALLICLEVGMHLLESCKRERTLAGSARRQADNATAACAVRARMRAGSRL
jgi:hypothetical protein